jgi:surfactin synthase thioesterase subunit
MSGRWVLRNPSPEAAARIFCFPYSGVGASMFNRWPRWIGDVEVCAIQPPGRENRSAEPHFGRYEELAEALVPALLPHLDRPFAFFGHCAGALPAFETARRLAELDLPTPARLVASAQVAPHDCPHDRFLDCTDEELVAELELLAVLRGGQPHPALIELALEVLHRDLDANRVYRREQPAPIPSGITVVHWSGDVEVTEPELHGWQPYSADTQFTVLDGGHYDFLAAPESLRQVLALAVKSAAPASG